MTATTKAKPTIPARSIALPIEHGSWGFLFEPLVLGMVIAPSIAAVFISLMVIGAFLLRQPLKFLLGDMRQGRTLPRTVIARRFTFWYAPLTLIGLAGILVTATPSSLLPFVAVAPLAIYLMVQDVARQSRELVPEILAAIFLSATPASMVIAAGSTWPVAISLSLIMIARLVPSIVYIRNRLNLEKGKPYSTAAPAAVHAVAIAGVAILAQYGLAPWLSVAMLGILFLRSAAGLSRFRRPTPAKVLGIWEVIYGVLMVTAVSVGYYSGL